MDTAAKPFCEPTTVRNRVAHLRRQAGLSRKQLADAVGINHRTVGYIEKHDLAPSLDLAYRMADLFGVEPTDVFFRDGMDTERTRVAAEHRSRLAVSSSGRVHAQLTPDDDPLVNQRRSILLWLLDDGEIEHQRLKEIGAKKGFEAEDIDRHLASLGDAGLLDTVEEPGLFGRFGATSTHRITYEGRQAMVSLRHA